MIVVSSVAEHGGEMTIRVEARPNALNRKLKKHAPKATKKYTCALKPVRGRDRHGKQVWVSTVYYVIGGKTKALKRIVSRDVKPPKEVVMHGKKLKFCQKHA